MLDGGALRGGEQGGRMAAITASLVLSATLMVLWGATMLFWMASDKPLVQVTVQIVNPVNHVPPVVRRLYATG